MTDGFDFGTQRERLIFVGVRIPSKVYELIVNEAVRNQTNVSIEIRRRLVNA